MPVIAVIFFTIIFTFSPWLSDLNDRDDILLKRAIAQLSKKWCAPIRNRLAVDDKQPEIWP
jgi:hypothetical protein